LEQREKAISVLVEPVKASLDKFEKQVQELEKNRASAYSSLETQLKSLSQTQEYLRNETGNLVKALRAPHVRGRWGELTLKRVVEMAGMLDHCDFIEQESRDTEEGRQRPDMIINMPGNKKIVVDAKVPLSAYLEALEAQDEEERRRKLADHARQLRDHIGKLGKKSYWEQYRNETPEFVVLFIPGEVFYSAALEADPTLIEGAASEKVMLASPANLIPLLRAVHYGWKQEAIAENAQQISNLGKELYERIGTLAKHWARVGGHLGGAVKAYNESVATLESRVLVSARKFEALKTTSAGASLDSPAQVEAALREISAPEMLAPPQSKDTAE
ncbi:DNA recombination protein RmuC, partial [bacterium]